MNPPLVSIVLPVYNGERYLAQAIESCLAQTLADWELILVDDASTDSTPVLIAGYVGADRRIRSLRHQVNRKLPAALNSGFDLACGRYLTWLSDDNQFHPQALAELAGYLDEHPGVDIVYADCRVVDEAGVLVGTRTAEPPGDLLLTNVVGACFLYRRAVQEQLNGYREEVFLAEDYDFWLRASRTFRLAPLHRQLYDYRRHGQSLSATRRREIFLSHERVVREHIRNLPWCDSSARFAAYLRLAIMARDNDCRIKTLAHLLRGLCCSPGLFLQKTARLLLKGMSPHTGE